MGSGCFPIIAVIHHIVFVALVGGSAHRERTTLDGHHRERHAVNGEHFSLGLCVIAGPDAAQQVVDQVGHIGDADLAVVVGVGIEAVEIFWLAAQQIVGQAGHVADVNSVVAVHVALSGRAVGSMGGHGNGQHGQ